MFHSLVRDRNSIKGLTLGNASWLGGERERIKYSVDPELLTRHNSLTEYLFELRNWNVFCCGATALVPPVHFSPQGADWGLTKTVTTPDKYSFSHSVWCQFLSINVITEFLNNSRFAWMILLPSEDSCVCVWQICWAWVLETNWNWIKCYSNADSGNVNKKSGMNSKILNCFPRGGQHPHMPNE